LFCGASDGLSPDYATAATLLTSALVQRGHPIVFGGGRFGIMGTIAETALALGGTVIGITSEFFVDREMTHPGLTEIHITPTISERKRLMIDISDAFVALPGGLGTLDEVSEVLSQSQLGLHDKPCALLNVNDYFEHLIEFVNHAVATEFVRPEARDLIMVESDPGRLAARISDLLT
jgi:hypothetical protein